MLGHIVTKSTPKLSEGYRNLVHGYDLNKFLRFVTFLANLLRGTDEVLEET